MTYTPLLKDYVGGGLASARPNAATLGPTIPAGMSAYYYATDTDVLSALAGGDTAWQTVGGGGSTSMTVKDGSTTLTGINKLNFTSGATVTAGGAGEADVAVSGGGGGGHIPLESGLPITRPALSGFTWVNQDIATAVEYTNGPISIQCGSAGNGINCLGKAVPGSTPWTLTAKLHLLLWPNNYTTAGIYVADATGKMVTLSWNAFYNSGQGSVSCSYQNSATSFNSEDKARSVFPFAGDMWFRIYNDGTYYHHMISRNGADWLQFHQTTLLAFIGAADTAGFYQGANNASGGMDSITSCWSFELVTGTGTDATWP